MKNAKEIQVAIVGASGAVGQELLGIFEKLNFPVSQITPLGSGRSAGQKISFRNKTFTISEVTPESFKDIDIAFFSAGSDVSKKFADAAVKSGAIVIDNSSAFRMEKDVPLIIPEINPEDTFKHKGILAVPNCTTIVALMALGPLHRVFKLKRFFASSYQAVSGAGVKGISELEAQTHSAAEKLIAHQPQVFRKQIAFNVIPQIDVFMPSGYTKEEEKITNEARKILHAPELKVSATCVRVPVYRAHSVSIQAEFESEISPEKAREVLSKASGVEIVDNPEKYEFPTPLDAAGNYNCQVGRIRRDSAFENGLSLWSVGDQLLKGAALNAVQMAELLIQNNFR